jgi:hypothetical protein
MERLTQRENDKLIMIKQDNGEYIPVYWDEDNFKAIKKLADYEGLEEQGLLVRLPCKVEEKLWCIVNSTIRELRVHHFDMPAFGTTDIVFRYADGFKLERFVGEIGKTVFFTREEAEKKLEEMKK